MGDRATKNALSKKFKVRGIPTLVILDGKTGETITLDGRDGVSSEPEAFPWKPPSVAEILSALPPFVDKEGEEVSLSERPGPLLLYFSAESYILAKINELMSKEVSQLERRSDEKINL